MSILACRSEFGLILLGNTGAGKSFLANCILNNNCFESRFSANSVTKVTSSVEFSLGTATVTVFDVPGLIEADQQAIDMNKQEIYKAFEQQPNCVIGFVFNVCGSGRLRDEDVVAFKAIRDAYNFAPRSLLLIVNGVSEDCPRDYHGDMTKRLAMHTGNADLPICFLKQIKEDVPLARKKLIDTLFTHAELCIPSKHVRRNSIRLYRDDVKRLKDEVKKQTQEYESRIQQMKGEILGRQMAYEQNVKQMEARLQAAEARSQEAVDKLFEESQRQIEELQRSGGEYREEVERLRKEAEKKARDEIRKNYEKKGKKDDCNIL